MNLTLNVSSKSTNSQTISKKKQSPPSQWDQLLTMLIRPPRADYTIFTLNQKFRPFSQAYTQQDLIINHKQQVLDVSLFKPRLQQLGIVVLYLHGNSSSRLEAIPLLSYLPVGYSLACFDFLGCGITKQQYISLGVRQSQQIGTVVDQLKKKYKVILWGRSMGASSALKYGKCQIIIADSPFQSIKKVCKDVAYKKKPRYVCGCLIQCLFPCVFYKLRKDVENQANFDMEDLDIKDAVKIINPETFLILITAKQDNLIDPQHSKKLFDKFRGTKKKIYICEGNHNSKRPENIMKQIFSCIEEYVKKNLNANQALTTNQIMLNI